MRIFAIAYSFVSILLAGCATGPVQPMSVPGLEKSNAVTVEDLRPSSEAQKENFSLLISSEAYGIFRVPESATNPTGIRLLSHRAYETLPALEKNPVIKVYHFVTYANLQSQLRWGAVGGAVGGALGAALMSQPTPPKGEVYTIQVDSSIFQQTATEEHRRAFYSEAENPSKTPVNVIYIETEMLGRRIATRSLVPPLKDKPHPTLAEVIDVCIANHLALYNEAAPVVGVTSQLSN